MTSAERVKFIVNWIKNYCSSINIQPVTLVVGVSGGIDSAVTSTLSAKTGLKTIAVSMPIKQNPEQHNLSLQHLKWLENNFPSKSKTNVGMFGVLPSKSAWLLFIWLAICILLVGGLVDKKDKWQQMDKEDAEMMETLDYEEDE